MMQRVFSPAARLIAGSIVYVAIVVVAIWMLGGEAWSLLGIAAVVCVAATSPFVGAAVVWLIVRRINRRVEPPRFDPPRGNG